MDKLAEDLIHFNKTNELVDICVPGFKRVVISELEVVDNPAGYIKSVLQNNGFDLDRHFVMSKNFSSGDYIYIQKEE